MVDACPVQTPIERERGEIVMEAEAVLLEKVLAAVRETDEHALAALRATGAEDVQSLRDPLVASLHQRLYCILCRADPNTFAGGDPKVAIAIIRNSQQIAKHYWGADIEPYPRPAP